MRRRVLRRVGQAIGVAAGVLAIALGLIVVFGPGMLEHELIGAMRARGLANATLEVRRIGWQSTYLNDLQLGEGLSAEAVEVTYTPWTVMGGQAHTLTLIGAQWRIAMTEDGLDLGPIEQWRAGGDDANRRDTVPLHRINLRAATVIVEARGQTHRFPITGHITRAKNQTWRFHLTVHDAGRAWQLTGALPGDARAVEMTLHRNDQPLAKVNYQRQPSRHRLTLKGPINNITRQWLGQDVAVKDGRFEGTIHFDAAGRPSNGKLIVRAARMTLADQTLNKPVLTVDQTAARQAKWQLRVNGQDASLTSGSTAWRDGALHIDTNPIQLTADGPLAMLVEAVTGATITGTAELRGRMGWRRNALAPQLTVSLKDTTLRDATGQYEITGLRTHITFDQWNPPTTAVGQRLRWAQATLGKLDLGEGAARFTLESPKQLLIEHLTWRMWEGRARLMGVRLDPTAPALNANLFVEKVALKPLLDTFTLGRAQGSGRVLGRIALRVQTKPRLRLTLGDSFLEAVGPGTLVVADAALVERLLARQAAGGGQDGYGAVVRRRIAQSLSDFRYDSLRFIVDAEREPPRLQAQFAGKGGEHDQALDLTVNLIEFQNYIDYALRIKMGLDRLADRRWLPAPAGTPREGG